MAALIFLGIFTISIKIYAQGAYQDELHQIQDGMFLLGAETRGALQINGIPILSMPYSSALKGILYGLLLKFFLGNFSIVSVRFFGISIYFASIISFNFLTRGILTSRSLLLFNLLLLTDATLALCVRNDWGPVSVSAAARLVFIAILIKLSKNEKEKSLFFALGLIYGFSVYEKLNNFVLLLPILLFFYLFKTKDVKAYFLMCFGASLGAAPLFVANIFSYVKQNNFISLQTVAQKQYSLKEFLILLKVYFFDGYSQVSSFIFGESFSYNFSGFMILSFFILSYFYYFTYKSHDKKMFISKRIFYIFSTTYFLTPVLLYILPAPIWVHHLMIGTPFQYIAIAFFSDRIKIIPKIIFRKIICIVLFLLCLLNIITYGDFILNTYRAKASLSWTPSFNKLSDFVKYNSIDAFYVCTTWGVEWNIYCSSPGQKNSMETFWNYSKIDFLKSINQKKYIYLIKLKIIKDSTTSGSTSLNNFNQVRADLENSSDWALEPLEIHLAELYDFTILKYSNRNVSLNCPPPLK